MQRHIQNADNKQHGAPCDDQKPLSNIKNSSPKML